ncbi:MAG: helix-turn-helix domain-containing protein [Barnesiella sp.]|nr:helix-turn-helix domain-containing protein [Barnesiella sp.]
MKLLIKNMVCRQCVKAVERILGEIDGVSAKDVGLGYALIDDLSDRSTLAEIARRLSAEGFELIQSRESEIVEQVKAILIDRVWNPETYRGITVSQHLAERVGASYSVISRLFSEIEGRTIESYLKLLRVERVKELIKYERMTLAEIADAAGYSSEGHLSRSFKQVTGMTPGQFRTLGRRTPLSEL